MMQENAFDASGLHEDIQNLVRQVSRFFSTEDNVISCTTLSQEVKDVLELALSKLRQNEEFFQVLSSRLEDQGKLEHLPGGTLVKDQRDAQILILEQLQSALSALENARL